MALPPSSCLIWVSPQVVRKSCRYVAGRANAAGIKKQTTNTSETAAFEYFDIEAMMLNRDNEAGMMMKQMKHWGVFIERDRYGWNRNRRKWFEISNESVGITQIKCFNQNEEEKTKLSIQLANDTNKSVTWTRYSLSLPNLPLLLLLRTYCCYYYSTLHIAASVIPCFLFFMQAFPPLIFQLILVYSC